jgi:hypothetical protein
MQSGSWHSRWDANTGCRLVFSVDKRAGGVLWPVYIFVATYESTVYNKLIMLICMRGESRSFMEAW